MHMVYQQMTVEFMMVVIQLKVRGCVCAYFQHSERREAFSPVGSALERMIVFSSLIATIIFGILAVVNQDKKNNRLLPLTRTIIFSLNKSGHRLKRCRWGVTDATPFSKLL